MDGFYKACFASFIGIYLGYTAMGQTWTNEPGDINEIKGM